jgi:hypothetical protein
MKISFYKYRKPFTCVTEKETIPVRITLKTTPPPSPRFVTTILLRRTQSQAAPGRRVERENAENFTFT